MGTQYSKSGHHISRSAPFILTKILNLRVNFGRFFPFRGAKIPRSVDRLPVQDQLVEIEILIETVVEFFFAIHGIRERLG